MQLMFIADQELGDSPVRIEAARTWKPPRGRHAERQQAETAGEHSSGSTSPCLASAQSSARGAEDSPRCPPRQVVRGARKTVPRLASAPSSAQGAEDSPRCDEPTASEAESQVSSARSSARAWEEQRLLRSRQSPPPDSAGHCAVSANRVVILVTLGAILVGSAACFLAAGGLRPRPSASRGSRGPVIAPSGGASEAPERGALVMESPLASDCGLVPCLPTAAQAEAGAPEAGAPELPSAATQTVLAAACGVGATHIEVASTEGFHVGNLVVIRSSSNWEMTLIAGFGSMMLGSPLSRGYPAGSTVTRFGEPPASLAKTTQVAITSTTTVSNTSASPSTAASIKASADATAVSDVTVTTVGSMRAVTGTSISGTRSISPNTGVTATPSTTARRTLSTHPSAKNATASLETSNSTLMQVAQHVEDSHHSLWCVTVLTSSEEKILLQIALSQNKSIFQCDGHAVYSNTVADFGKFKSRLLDADFQRFMTATRTGGFAKLWEQVVSDGDFRQHDWTVKVHPDAVFLPVRLRSILTGSLAQRGRSESGIIINSCKTGVRMPLEVLSTRALEAFAAGHASCKSGNQESVYLLDCMGKLGVTRVDGFELLADKVCDGGELDQSEYWKCTGEFPVYHPFNHAEAFLLCLDVAERANHT